MNRRVHQDNHRKTSPTQPPRLWPMRAIFPCLGRHTTLIAAIVVSQLTFAATPIDGWYSRAFGGYTYLPDNINKTVKGVHLNNAHFQSGFDAGGALGYKSNPMRYEGEITYLDATLERFDLNGVRQTRTNGYAEGLFGMANVYYDFPGYLMSCLQPFLGVGIGYGFIQDKLQNTRPLPSNKFVINNSVFAYQGTAGITFNFSENYALDIAYRYLATQHATNFGRFFQANMANVSATYRFDGGHYK